MSDTERVLTGAERAVGSCALAALLAGLLSAAAVNPAPVAVVTPAPHPPVVVVTRAPAAPRPAAKPTPAPRPVAKPGPLPPAPPLTGCPVRKKPPSGPGKPLRPPAVAEAALPAPLPVLGKARDLDVVKGKGVWATPFGKSRVDVTALVRTARSTGVRSIWVRTGGTRQGYYGDRFLPELVPVAHRAGIAVIAWDFPFLSDPVADSLRAQQALAAGVDAFSPDVETAAEGTYATARRVQLYLSLVRRYAGARPVIATVPRPSEFRTTFPYKAFVPYSDVFAPMVYWSCNEPGSLAQQSIRTLGALLPVATVGQGYDMGPDGGRRGTPSKAETLRFLDASRRAGAIGASIWTLEHVGPAQLTALAHYRWP